MRVVLFDENGLKQCSKCKLLLTKDSFNIGSKYKSGYSSSCKQCKKKFRDENTEKISQAKREYYTENREEVLERQKQYRINNIETVKEAEKIKYEKYRDKIKTRVSKYNKENPDINRKAAKKYRDATPELQAAKAAKYRFSKKKAYPKWSESEFEKFAIKEIYALAQQRTEITGVPHAVDHIVPLKSDLVCGLHCVANLRVITAFENSSKSNRYWPDMP